MQYNYSYDLSRRSLDYTLGCVVSNVMLNYAVFVEVKRLYNGLLWLSETVFIEGYVRNFQGDCTKL